MTDTTHPYPMPANELGRLAALRRYEVMDTPPERDFDHLASLAARIFSVPTALISLVNEDRQFMKARVGLDICESGRDIAFCSHAIAQPDVMFVPDARLDPRFANNPFVTEAPFIRFYAGAPLIAPSGHAVGTFCIIDSKPRASFSDEEAETLKKLAQLVVDRMEVRRLNLQRERNEARLDHMAHFDSLTDLPNRASLWSHLADVMADNRPVTVIAADLDGFKDVNDSRGHPYGDEVLRCMAARIRSAVAEDIFVARPAGDEFIIVMEDTSDPRDADLLCRSIIDSVAAPCAIEGLDVHLGVSLGVALAPQHGATPQDILASADLALCRAKTEGRGRFELYTPALSSAAQSRRTCEGELRTALENGEFELFYQPQVLLADSELAGAEALLRWRHPERGLLSPGAFMPVLENMPLAVEVGEWAIRTACRHAASWHAQGVNLQLAVNLFGAQFGRHADLYGVVESALADSGLPAHKLELEITENIILRHDTMMASVLSKLRRLNVGVAFDDYGTGFASLSQLKRFPLTKLKIDQSFIRGFCTDKMDAAVVDAVLHLGRNFGFDVVAEGVELLEQHDRLVSLGCQWGQGFLYGRPMPISEFARRVSEWRDVA